MKKRLVPASALLLSGVALFLFWSSSTRDRSGSIGASGIVEGREVTLSAKVGGRIREICCREGDAVQAGMTAIELESDELKASVEQARAGVGRSAADITSAQSQVANAEAAVAVAEADLKGAEADLEKARVQMDEQKLDQDRARELYQKNYIARSVLDQAAAAYDGAAASYKSAQTRILSGRARREAAVSQVRAMQGQLLSAQAHLKEAEAGLHFNEARLRDAVITSPVDGVVTFRSLEKGEQAAAGTAIITVVASADRTVRVDLEETAVAALKLNAEAQIRAEGIAGRVFKGRVIEIGRYAEFATQRDVTRGRQDIKTFRVRVAFDDESGLLKSGMTVLVELPKKNGPQ